LAKRRKPGDLDLTARFCMFDLSRGLRHQRDRLRSRSAPRALTAGSGRVKCASALSLMDLPQQGHDYAILSSRMRCVVSVLPAHGVTITETGGPARSTSPHYGRSDAFRQSLLACDPRIPAWHWRPRTRPRPSGTAQPGRSPRYPRPLNPSQAIQRAIADHTSPSHSGETICWCLHAIGTSEIVPLT
jgi:hypothetical protein